MADTNEKVIENNLQQPESNSNDPHRRSSADGTNTMAQNGNADSTGLRAHNGKKESVRSRSRSEHRKLHRDARDARDARDDNENNKDKKKKKKKQKKQKKHKSSGRSKSRDDAGGERAREERKSPRSPRGGKSRSRSRDRKHRHTHRHAHRKSRRSRSQSYSDQSAHSRSARSISSSSSASKSSSSASRSASSRRRKGKGNHHHHRDGGRQDSRLTDVNRQLFLRHYNNQIQAAKKELAPAPKDANGAPQQESELFWDGFNWVARDLTQSTKDKRSIQLIGLPLDKMQFTEYQLAQFIAIYMQKNSLSEHNNTWPIRSCIIYPETKSARVELTSVDEAKRVLMIKKIPILDREVRVAEANEPIRPISATGGGVEAAQRAAMAQAATIKALKGITQEIVDKKESQRAAAKKNEEGDGPE